MEEADAEGAQRVSRFVSLPGRIEVVDADDRVAVSPCSEPGPGQRRPDEAAGAGDEESSRPDASASAIRRCQASTISVIVAWRETEMSQRG